MNFIYVYKHMYGSWYERQVLLPIVIPISSISASTPPQYLTFGKLVMTEEKAQELVERINGGGGKE